MAVLPVRTSFYQKLRLTYRSAGAVVGTNPDRSQFFTDAASGGDVLTALHH